MRATYQPPHTGASDDTSSGRHVNNLLHTLRGEQFRHSQNLHRARAIIPRALQTARGPTLPVSTIHSSTATEEGEKAPPPRALTSSSTTLPAAGPSAPRSWLPKPEPAPADPRHTFAWRARALSLAYSQLPSSTPSSSLCSSPESRSAEDSDTAVSPLVHLCFRLLLHILDDPADYQELLVPWLTPHLRRELLRFTAVHAPLSSARLYPLCEPSGHVDGELIIVGPAASVRNDIFPRSGNPLTDPASPVQDDWDAHEADAVPSLRTLVILSAAIPSSVLMSAPPTLMHLALIDVPSSLPIHRLPALCPQLQLLDLSFNRWLQTTTTETGKALERVDWRRWPHLKILGMRDCHMDDGFAYRVNRDRWVDVDIIS